MKKYIRTKNNELYKYVTDFDEYIIATKNGIYSESIKKDNILNQADTIEELCDEFVIKVGVHNIVLHDLDSALYYVKDFKNHELVKDYEIYGAVWSNEGLIYVAKMNDKGEFELI